MALSHVASTGAQGAGPVASITTPAIDTTGADLLVVTYTRFFDVGPAATPITDSKGNTWVASTAELGDPGGLGFVRQFHAANPIVGTGHTFTFTLAAAGFPSVAASAFSGVVLSSPLDKTASGTDTTTPHNSPNTAALAQPDEVVVGSFADGVEFLNNGNAIGTGYSAGFVGDSTSTLMGIGQEWKIVSSTAAVQSDFTTTQNQNSANQVATYKAAAGNPAVFEFRVPEYT